MWTHINRLLRSLLVVVLASVCSSDTFAAPEQRGFSPTRVWVIGDSLTRGLLASSEAATFRNRLFAKLQERHPGQVRLTYWQGVCTLARFAKRWDGMPGKPDLIFIELGINDLTRNPDCPQVPEEEWRERYATMLDRIMKESPGVRIVVGTVPWSGWGEDNPRRKLAILYSKWIQAAAAQRHLAVADLWAATLDRSDGLSDPDEASVFAPYRGDNFHPNDIGHARLAEAFFTAYVLHYDPDQRIFIPHVAIAESD